MFELIRIPGQGVQNIHKCNSRRLENMRASGIRVSAFHSRRGKGNRLQLNFRNHRKIVVADGHRAWVGGHNVGDEYMGIDPEFGHWRDTHIRLDGPRSGCSGITARVRRRSGSVTAFFSAFRRGPGT